MTRRRLALVAENPDLAKAIRDRLGKARAEATLQADFASIGEHVGPDSDGVLVLASGAPAEASSIVNLVRQLLIQEWPGTILLVAAEDGAGLAGLDPVRAVVAGLFHWPSDAQALVNRLEKELARKRLGFRQPNPDCLPQWLGSQLLRQTPSLQLLAEPLAMAASHDVTVLLTGETGTGKTHLARLIHTCSPRKDQRLLVVPCGALAPSLIESEFFGHVKGAFTGADRPKIGKFEAVGAGTLLLDEIDALGLEQQARLLRVIETGEFEPVGSNETRRCQARLIAASNWNLEDAVERGKFRRDLYYRLNVLAFYLPPLRERPQDVAALAMGLAVRFTAKFGKDLFGVSPEAMGALQAFPWPGNIRQLENVMQQAVLASTGPELLLQHLPQLVQEQAAPGNGSGLLAAGSLLEQNRMDHERAAIQKALTAAGHSRTSAARALGISRVTLYKKMKKLGLMDRSA